MEVKHGLSSWDSTHQGQPGYGHYWAPSWPAAETNTDPRFRAIYRCHQSIAWWQDDDTGPLSSWEEQDFVVTGIGTLDMDLIGLHVMLLPKLLPAY